MAAKLETEFIIRHQKRKLEAQGIEVNVDVAEPNGMIEVPEYHPKTFLDRLIQRFLVKEPDPRMWEDKYASPGGF